MTVLLVPDDLWAAAARLAAGRRVGGRAPRPARPPRPDQRHRLPPRLAGQRDRPGEKGGGATGRNPTDRGKPGSKRHVPVDGRGVPLALALTAANIHDSLAFEPLTDAVPARPAPAQDR